MMHMNSVLVINFKMSTSVGILKFRSKTNTTTWFTKKKMPYFVEKFV